MNCFQNCLEILTSSIFPSSFGNVSCIENAFWTVYGAHIQDILLLFMFSITEDPVKNMAPNFDHTQKSSG
jgi:hypothetical protein